MYFEEPVSEMERRHSDADNDRWRGFPRLSKERFLDFRDRQSGELYDDLREIYEPKSSCRGIPLEKYVYALQKITGKRPQSVRHWNYLKVEGKT